MKRLLIILPLLIVVGSVFAYPIPPQTLRKLIEASPYIVFANVHNPNVPAAFYDAEAKDTLLMIHVEGDGLADLNITSCLKGNLKPAAHIQVAYAANLVCPAPPDYPDGKTVLAFLEQDTNNLYHTIGLSYGAKEMESETVANSYRARVLEYLDILRIKDKKQRKQATVEWLVKCSENKATRWEGAYELSGGYFTSYANYGKEEPFSVALSDVQRDRLAVAFFAADTIGDTELYLAGLLPKSTYTRLRAHLVASLSYADYYMAPDIMKKIVDVFPDKELQQIYKAVKQISYSDVDRVAQQRVLVDRFIKAAKGS